MPENHNPQIRDQVKLTNPEKLYEIRDKNGQLIDFEQATSWQLFNHYRHNMTNYDQVLDDVRDEQGYVTGRQEKQAAVGAAEQVLKQYRDEHVKVIKDSQYKGDILKKLMRKAGVGTATALTNILDSWSDKIKDISKLENSRNSLQYWNDTYRVQKVLVKKLLVQEGISDETIKKIDEINGTRSANTAIKLGSNLLNLEESEILKGVKAVVYYTKLKLDQKS